MIHWVASTSMTFAHLDLKFPPKFKCQDLEIYDEKGCPYIYLKLYGVAMV